MGTEPGPRPGLSSLFAFVFAVEYVRNGSGYGNSAEFPGMSFENVSRETRCHYPYICESGKEAVNMGKVQGILCGATSVVSNMSVFKKLPISAANMTISHRVSRLQRPCPSRARLRSFRLLGSKT